MTRYQALLKLLSLEPLSITEICEIMGGKKNSMYGFIGMALRKKAICKFSDSSGVKYRLSEGLSLYESPTN